MNMLETLLLVVHLLVAVAVCGFVLLQHGKGADMGAAFGSGASGSLFGAAGSANFLSRTTAILATVFFVTSLGLTWLGTQHGSRDAVQGGVMETLPASTDKEKASDVPSPSGAGGSAAPDAGKSAAPAAPATPPVGGAGSKAGDVPK